MTSSSDYSTYDLGDFTLQSGQVLKSAWIAYTTLGSPSLPAIIYPTWYSGLIADNLWLTGDDMTLSPAKYYIIVPALFGNGQSTSPSNTPSAPRPFPNVTFYDNVRAQHQLVTQHLGIKHAKAVLGWSMGAGQTYQWATQYPDFMDGIVPFCGSARTSLHNQVFLEGVKAALLGPKGAVSAGVCAGERQIIGTSTYQAWTEEQREAGLKALGRVYAGWGFSQAFYREKLFATAPAFKGRFQTLEDFMVAFWEKWACSKDPENMLTMLWTWQAGDVSKQEAYGGNFEAAMQAITAKALVLPGKTDLYFPPEDSEYEVKCMRAGVGACEAFPSIWYVR